MNGTNFRDGPVDYAVLLYGHRIGTLSWQGDVSRFNTAPEYVSNPHRPVLGLYFEEHLTQQHKAALRLPAWFSNLLPEGLLRERIAAHSHVSSDREMALLANVGIDLPGAVQVVHNNQVSEQGEWVEDVDSRSSPQESRPASERWRFSLAGVAMKLSMLQTGERLTLPASGRRGDWILKLPDARFRSVPHNEYTMMNFAAACGINIPEIRMVHRDELPPISDSVWPPNEEWAYAIKRFDRQPDQKRTPIHIEDFAQIRNFYPEKKYQGNYESVATIIAAACGNESLREFARRLVVNILVGNGDAHLKNWSLTYPDRISPQLAPAYDIVSTFLYRSEEDGEEDLALKLAGDRRFDKMSTYCFERLEQKVDSRMGTTSADLPDVVSETISKARESLPEIEDVVQSFDSGKRFTNWMQSRLLQF